MTINSRPLPATHSMRHIGTVVAICVTNTPNALDAGSQSRGCCINLITKHPHSHLSGERRRLISIIIRHNLSTLFESAIIHVLSEDIELLSNRFLLDLTTVLYSRDVLDRPIVDRNIIRLKNSPPVRILLLNPLELRCIICSAV